MLRDNTGAFGTLDTDKFLAALLTHRNKPDPETSMSSSDIVFGRKIKDLMPIKPSQLKVDARLTKILRQREAVMAKRHINRGKELDNHTRELKPINVGDTVSIQNGHGNTPLRWDNTGMIVEVAAFDKYVIKVDGRRRLTTRNRRLLRPIQTYKEAISKPCTKADINTHAKDDMPTITQPRRSDRMAKRNKAALTGHRPSH